MTKKKRKQDKRTTARILRERQARAAAMREARKGAARDRRLSLLPELVTLAPYGLSLADMARELEARRVPTVTGSKRWNARQVQRLLDHFRPFLAWRDMRPSTQSARFYVAHVRHLLDGMSYPEALRRAGWVHV